MHRFFLPALNTRRLRIAVPIIVLLALSSTRILSGLGRYLVLNEGTGGADVIVILNGRDTERSLAAVDLYKEGRSDLVVAANGSMQPGCEDFRRRLQSPFDDRVFIQRAIEALGVPPRAFKMIGGGVASTYDEACTTKEFMKSNGLRSVLIVTSKWHSRRAYLTFKSVMNDQDGGMSVSVHASKYDTFSPEVWWRNESDAELVLYEYLRFAYYILTLRIDLLELL